MPTPRVLVVREHQERESPQITLFVLTQSGQLG